MGTNGIKQIISCDICPQECKVGTAKLWVLLHITLGFSKAWRVLACKCGFGLFSIPIILLVFQG